MYSVNPSAQPLIDEILSVVLLDLRLGQSGVGLAACRTVSHAETLLLLGNQLIPSPLMALKSGFR